MFMKNKWMNKMWYIHTMEYYSDTCYNMNKPSQHYAKGKNQAQPYTLGFHLYDMSRLSESIGKAV